MDSHRRFNERWIWTEFLIENLLEQIVVSLDVMWFVANNHKLFVVHKYAIISVVNCVEELKVVGLWEAVVVMMVVPNGFIKNFIPAVYFRIFRKNFYSITQILK